MSSIASGRLRTRDDVTHTDQRYDLRVHGLLASRHSGRRLRETQVERLLLPLVETERLPLRPQQFQHDRVTPGVVRGAVPSSCTILTHQRSSRVARTGTCLQGAS
jgi:hypothetical protein